MKKKLIAALLCVAMTATMVVGCGSKADEKTESPETEANGSSNDAKAELVFATFSAIDEAAFDRMGLVERFQELYPNVTIEFESYKDATEFNKAMSIRASAQELPDVMYMKATEFANYKDFLLDMKDMEAASNNMFAEAYALEDGKVCGISTVASQSYMYYWEDMFEEAGVEVPKTWDEFKQLTLDLKEYFGAKNPNFVPLCIGAKDTWSTYPYVEYMPMMETGNGGIFSTMATMDEPFAEGTDLRTAFNKVNDLFTLGVCGEDPLGVGFDQYASLFKAKQAGMIATSAGFIAQTADAGVDMTGLSTFFLPSRNTTEDTQYVVTLADNFLSIPKDGKNVEIAKAFVEFFFSEEIYGEFIAEVSGVSTMSNAKAELHPALQAASENAPDAQMVAQLGGSPEYAAIEAEIQYNCKKVGSEFFVQGYDYEGKMNELNASWKDARSKLGIE